MDLRPLKVKDWRSRWLQASRGVSLHRIAAIEWEDGDKIAGKGAAVCGKRSRFHMPGIFNRMGATRCQMCCAVVNVPVGLGAPYNDHDDNLTKRERNA